MREEASLEVVFNAQGQAKGYLIGGFNGSGIKQIVQLELLKKVKPTIEWNSLEVQGHEKLESKFGQATTVEGTDIYIFGGADLCFKNPTGGFDGTDERKVLYNQKLNISRQCNSQLIKFDTQANKLTLMPPGDYIVSPKRDHCIAKYGRFILSFGGINDLGRVLDDVDIYDTEYGFWETLKIQNPMEGLCYSACASVFYPDRYDENLDTLEVDFMPQPNWGRVEHFIKEEGIYLFGGRNKNSEVSV